MLWQTMQFGISLYVKSSAGQNPTKFFFQSVPAHDVVGINIGRDDILQNFCGRDDVAMNGDKPWRGSREKAPLFLQMLIEASSSRGDVVMDCTASIGLFSSSCFVPFTNNIIYHSILTSP